MALARESGGRAAGFTLIEMMIVILLIVTLAGMSFRMVTVMGRNNDISKTRAKLEQVGNALEEYRSIFGKYPDVRFYPIYSQTAEKPSKKDDLRVGTWQPVAYEFPSEFSYTEQFGNLKSVATTLKKGLRYGNGADNTGAVYTFGLVSYFVPRYNGAAGEGENIRELAGYISTGRSAGTLSDDGAIKQWTVQNSRRDGAFGDSERDLAAARRILPHLGTYLTGEDKPNKDVGIISWLGGSNDGRARYVVNRAVTNLVATIRDSWYQDLRYRSLPPYDSYELWSIGPDGTDGTADDIYLGRD
ncbi:MAG: type II secretion system protein [Kiritimatiellae bacterium]|nr:type II secretion system protein [Kiritimatiellia bacterium]